MNEFSFSVPQNIVVGRGTMAKLTEIAKKLGGSYALIISDPNLEQLGLVKKTADYLEEAGIAVDSFTETEANPSVETVDKATEKFKAAGADFIVALGGG